MRKNVNLAAAVTVSNLRMRVREVKRTAATTTNGVGGRIAGADKVRKSNDERIQER